MTIKKALSYVLGIAVGLLAIAPPLTYSIPVIVNSYTWIYVFMVAALFAFFLLSTSLPTELKIFVVCLFVCCFLSLAPYLSFNAYILVVAATWAFLGFTKSDYEPILGMIEAVFWVQLIVAGFQWMGMDKLLNFDRNDHVFLGTLMQNMRFGSFLAIAAPFLVLRHKLYIVPLILMFFLTESASLGLALVAGCTVYYMAKNGWERRGWLYMGLAAGAFVLFFDKTSVSVAFTCGRAKVWEDIVRTWLMNTSGVNPDGSWVVPLAGPIDWKSIFIGRGLDTFMGLFPVFKHDPNPYGQAHNCHLQLLWELGFMGYSILAAYVVRLAVRVRKSPILLGGLACMTVNMFFAFPTRMGQTMLMMVAFLALCEQYAQTKGAHYAG